MKIQLRQKLFSWAILGISLFYQKSWAGCINPNHPQEVLDCALSQHPWIHQAQTRAAQGNQLESVARQRPNPDLEANTTFGNSQGQSVNNLQFTLYHTFELGGKRSSRIAKAQAERDVIATEVLRAKEQVAMTLVPALFRLRQIQTELHVIHEAMATFAHISVLLKARPRLTPDQEVALTTFKLAESDYRVRQRSLEGEAQSLEKVIALPFGLEFKVHTKMLPPQMEQWPEIKIFSETQGFSGSEITRSRAEVKSSEAEVALAQSNAWPNLRIGPSLQSQTQGGIAYPAYGLSLTVSLPIYQANGGGKSFAIAGQTQAEAALYSTNIQLLTERNREAVAYQAALKAMEESVTLKEMEKRHQKLDHLFYSGRIQASLVIEGHRQIVDLTGNLNAQELKAITSLWRIYIIEGRVLREKI